MKPKTFTYEDGNCHPEVQSMEGVDKRGQRSTHVTMIENLATFCPSKTETVAANVGDMQVCKLISNQDSWSMALYDSLEGFHISDIPTSIW